MRNLSVTRGVRRNLSRGGVLPCLNCPGASHHPVNLVTINPPPQVLIKQVLELQNAENTKRRSKKIILGKDRTSVKPQVGEGPSAASYDKLQGRGVSTSALTN